MAKKLNNNKSGKAAAHKMRKREEAEGRQKEYENLTVERRLALIRKRPGKSLRERARLESAS